MKLPSQIKSRHKIRDAEIINLFRDKNLFQSEIAEIMGLTERRIGQILMENKVFLAPDREFEKAKRINRLKRAIKNCEFEGLKTSKDFSDLQKEIRAEIEGDKAQIENHTHITYLYDGIDEKTQFEIQTARLPNTNTQIEKKI